jgi:hypothetical protein
MIYGGRGTEVVLTLKGLIVTGNLRALTLIARKLMIEVVRRRLEASLVIAGGKIKERVYFIGPLSALKLGI